MNHSDKESAPFSGAKIALFCGDHLVTYQRDDKPGIPFRGFWDLPGGGREGDETPLECALRELEEEFSISIPATRVHWLKVYPAALRANLPSWFLVGTVTSADLARVRFGAEGQHWKLMRSRDFLSRQDVPPQLQVRLAEYLHQRARPEPGEVTAEWSLPPLRVSALFRDRLSRDLVEFRPTHVISLLDPTLPAHRMPIFPAGTCVLQRQFFDGDSPKAAAPDAMIVSDILDFLASWLECQRSEEARLLIHCHMGASRSTAVAMVALALVYGPGREEDAFAHGLTIMNKPWPNLNVIRLADQQLGRHGALAEQLLAYRARYPRRLEAYGRLNRRRGAG